jgi:hypothetical protein
VLSPIKNYIDLCQYSFFHNLSNIERKIKIMKINKVLKYTGASIALAGTVTAIPAVITSCSDNKGQYTVSLMVQDYGAWETFTGETITPDESAV